MNHLVAVYKDFILKYSVKTRYNESVKIYSSVNVVQFVVTANPTVEFMEFLSIVDTSI